MCLALLSPFSRRSASVLLGGLTIVAGLVLWQSLHSEDLARLERESARARRDLTADAGRRLSALEGTVLRLADPSPDGALRSRADLVRAYETAFTTTPSLTRIELLGGDGRLALLAAADGRPDAQARPAPPDLVAAAATAHANARPLALTHTGSTGPAGPNAPGGAEIVWVAPLAGAPGTAALVGSFSAERAFADLGGARAQDYRIALVADGREIVAAGPAPAEPAARWRREIELTGSGAAGWRLAVTPGAELVAAGRSRLPTAVLGLAVAVGLLLSLTGWLGEEAARRARRFEAAVAERTRELAAATAEARAANDAKDRFLAMLGHELRNPLAAIGTALAVLDRDDGAHDGDRESAMRAIASRQMRHLARLVDDLLDVSRIEQDKLTFHRERLDLARLVAEAAEAERPRLEKQGLRLALELPTEPLWIEGDPTRLNQVALNLVSNAAKFSDPGGTITVRGFRDEGTGEAGFSVRDTGAGLTADELEEIFAPFAQTPEAARRGTGGLGLGLAIVRGIVERHHGSIRAASDGPGHGAELTVRLPLRAAPASAAEAAQDPAGTTTRRVLVIDDHPDSVAGMRELLVLLGHEVETARDGQAGLELATSFGPDVVICDLHLGGDLDGYAVAARLAAAPAHPHLIALTGYGDQETARRAEEAGFDRHLTKPVDPDRLGEIVAAAHSSVPAPTTERTPR